MQRFLCWVKVHWMVNFSTSNVIVDVKAGAAKTENGSVSLWGGFDPLGFKVWRLCLFLLLCLEFLSLLPTFYCASRPCCCNKFVQYCCVVMRWSYSGNVLKLWCQSFYWTSFQHQKYGKAHVRRVYVKALNCATTWGVFWPNLSATNSVLIFAHVWIDLTHWSLLWIRTYYRVAISIPVSCDTIQISS